MARSDELAEPTTVAAYTEAIASALRLRGIDPETVLGRVSPEHAGRNDPLRRISDSVVNAIYARAVERTGDEYFGFAVADCVVLGLLHALGYALLASETLEDLCQRLARYYAVVSQSATLAVEIAGETLSLQAVPRSPGLCAETQDAFAALVMRLLRSAHREDLCPLRLELMRPLPAGGAGPFVQRFGCPVEFGCPRIRFHFPLTVMREPLLGASRELAQHNDQIVMSYLEKLDRDDIVNRVRTQLVNGLSAGVFGRSEIAARLHMSPSTLQSKLARRGMSFQHVLDNTRHELALGYVTQSRLSITEIAFMLGFSDVSNFNRAFRRWTGMAPSEYRLAPR